MKIEPYIEWAGRQDFSGLSGWIFLAFVGVLLFLSWKDTRAQKGSMDLSGSLEVEKIPGTWSMDSQGTHRIVGDLVIESPTNNKEGTEKPDLQVEIGKLFTHSMSEVTNEPEGLFQHPPIFEMEVTFIPTKSIQIARLHLEVGKEKELLEPLGPPIYAETIKLPKTLTIAETYTIKFQIPQRYVGKGPNDFRLQVYAGGKDWFSKGLQLSFP